jgi:hypothetical protein
VIIADSDKEECMRMSKFKYWGTLFSSDSALIEQWALEKRGYIVKVEKIPLKRAWRLYIRNSEPKVLSK